MGLNVTRFNPNNNQVIRFGVIYNTLPIEIIMMFSHSARQVTNFIMLTLDSCPMGLVRKKCTAVAIKIYMELKI